ncbi:MULTISPECIES: dethiobiotin synthase [Prochlorococcus]|uniref:ATP-dependent dethiobiotin synthetase BioD n=1 Tax=Prochlorococcus marinus (strain SARG / CCMP1375 / SS120) TaxID=167539 RepID=Q7VA42_PROMA|nr:MULTISPECIES: dethiobiotin synthase [Prochlorococcus]AAQ00669.1 Dethiobiotin synthetase [Prochlorococcus marinus subsp. marinus str. CCMP1375]
MNIKSLKVVVCGTDTDVGKTVVSSLLVQGLSGVYWKPIQSGLEGGGDTNRVCELLTLPKERWIPEKYKFKAAVSPHWAAEQEHIIIKPNLLKVPLVNQSLIIETAGGVMVPLTRQYLQIDLLKEWMLPIIIVARSGLGTLNHTLLSIEALTKRKIPILGLIINGPLHKDNPKTLEQFGGVPVIAQLPKLASLSASSLAKEWLKQDIRNRLEQLLETTNR